MAGNRRLEQTTFQSRRIVDLLCQRLFARTRRKGTVERLQAPSRGSTTPTVQPLWGIYMLLRLSPQSLESELEHVRQRLPCGARQAWNKWNQYIELTQGFTPWWKYTLGFPTRGVRGYVRLAALIQFYSSNHNKIHNTHNPILHAHGYGSGAGWRDNKSSELGASVDAGKAAVSYCSPILSFSRVWLLSLPVLSSRFAEFLE